MNPLEPVRKQITVNRSPEEAFKIWTDGLASWWPMEKHSIGGERVTGAVFEPKAGGRVYEVWDDGQERDWAEVLVFEPPRRFVIAWRPNPDRPPPTEVEVRFVADGAATRVELEHRGWERLGDDGGPARESYDNGWVLTLERYAEAAR
jgi:uncharacterized protein YndB with AHSA1/START domain